MKDVELGLVRRQRLRAFDAEEEVASEQRMPRAFGDQADRQRLLRVGAAAKILDPQLPGGKVLPHAVEQGVELRRLERRIDRAPRDVILGRRVADDELVFGRPSGVGGRVDDERAADADPPRAPADRLFVERRREVVAVNRGSLIEA